MRPVEVGIGERNAIGACAYRSAAAGLLVLMLCGLSLMRNGAWQSEASLLEDSVRKTPDKPRPYYNLGCVYSELHRYGEAAAMFTRAVELYPLHNSTDDERSRDFHVHVYLNRGMAYAGEGMEDDAIDDYTRVLSLRPEHAEAYRSRGDCYRRAGNATFAARDYQNACDLGDERGCAALQAAGW